MDKLLETQMTAYLVRTITSTSLELEQARNHVKKLEAQDDCEALTASYAERVHMLEDQLAEAKLQLELMEGK